MFYYTYMLKSISPGYKKTYVGYTNSLELRLDKHNSGKGAKSTKGYKWIIIYKKKYWSKSKAMKEEYLLKKNYILRKKIKDSYIKNYAQI